MGGTSITRWTLAGLLCDLTRAGPVLGHIRKQVVYPGFQTQAGLLESGRRQGLRLHYEENDTAASSSSNPPGLLLNGLL